MMSLLNHIPPVGTAPKAGRLRPWLVAIAVGGVLACGNRYVSAQPAGEAFATWKDVEASPRFKEVVAALKGNGPFNDAAREFVSTIVLPLFEKDDGLAALDDVRKKTRDRLLLVIGNDDAFEQASLLMRDRLNDLARDANQDLLLRVNAMLFIGEQTDKARIPWSPARETLVAALRDEAVDPAVQIAAVTGLGSHLASLARLNGEQAAAVRDAITSSLPALLPTKPADPDATGEQRSPAVAWLASRGLAMLPVAINPVTPEIAKRLVAMIDDDSWPFDVRVRAASALGRTVGPESGINTGDVVASLRTIAIASLDADRLEAQRLLDLQAYKAGGGGVGGGEGMGFSPRGSVPGFGGFDAGQAPQEDGLSMGVCRRAAWRLYSLGDAIVPDSKKGGLAVLFDKDREQEAAEARQLGIALKEFGQALDAEPFGYVLLEALDVLDPAGAKKRAAEDARGGSSEQAAPDASPAAPGSEKPDPKPTDSPFGNSPF